MGLKVSKPTEEQYNIIKEIYDNINEELEFNKPFNPVEINGAYTVRRVLVESLKGGADYFVTEGEVVHGQDSNGQQMIQNNIQFEGWRHEETEMLNLKISNIGSEDVYYERSDEFQI